MLLRLPPLLYLILVAQTLLAQHSVAAKLKGVPDACPTTKPYQTSLFIPPLPDPTKADSGTFWFGTDRLWTMVPVDGGWSVPSLMNIWTPALTNQTLGWWRQGYDAHAEPWPKLNVIGKRLDSSEPPMVFDRVTSLPLVGLRHVCRPELSDLGVLANSRAT